MSALPIVGPQRVELFHADDGHVLEIQDLTREVKRLAKLAGQPPRET